MTNFLTTYLLHSTGLLTAMWLTMRIARPRSPVLVERLWKLAAVLPVITALAISSSHSHFKSVADAASVRQQIPSMIEADAGSVGHEQTSHVINRLADDLSVKFPAERSDSVESLPHDQSSSLPVTTSMDESDQPVDVPFAVDLPTDSLTIRVENDRRMGTLARPLENKLDAEGTGKSAHPTSIVPDAAELVAGTDVPPTSVSDVEVAPNSAESWLLPTWQLTSTLLPICAVIGAAWLVIRSARFRWRLRNARRVERGRAVELLRELQSHACRSRLGLRPDQKLGRDGVPTYSPRTIRLLIVPGFAEPAAFGILQPTIVLPPSCESLPREELRAVLAHELGHIARGDVWWLSIGRVLTTVLGFQPLNRIARREWTRAAECLCDEWAVARGVERLTLARCLTALAEHRLTGIALADALAAVGSPSTLRQRIERLVAEPKTDPWSQRSRRWLVSGSVLATAVVVALLLPLPKALTASVPRPSGSGLVEDHEQHGPLPDGRGTEVDAEFITEIEAELSSLRTELQHAARLAEQRHDPVWTDAAESLRERERQIDERWRQWISR